MFPTDSFPPYDSFQTPADIWYCIRQDLGKEVWLPPQSKLPLIKITAHHQSKHVPFVILLCFTYSCLHWLANYLTSLSDLTTRLLKDSTWPQRCSRWGWLSWIGVMGDLMKLMDILVLDLTYKVRCLSFHFTSSLANFPVSKILLR